MEAVHAHSSWNVLTQAEALLRTGDFELAESTRKVALEFLHSSKDHELIYLLQGLGVEIALRAFQYTNQIKFLNAIDLSLKEYAQSCRNHNDPVRKLEFQVLLARRHWVFGGYRNALTRLQEARDTITESTPPLLTLLIYALLTEWNIQLMEEQQSKASGDKLLELVLMGYGEKGGTSYLCDRPQYLHFPYLMLASIHIDRGEFDYAIEMLQFLEQRSKVDRNDTTLADIFLLRASMGVAAGNYGLAYQSLKRAEPILLRLGHRFKLRRIHLLRANIFTKQLLTELALNELKHLESVYDRLVPKDQVEFWSVQMSIYWKHLDFDGLERTLTALASILPPERQGILREQQQLIEYFRSAELIPGAVPTFERLNFRRLVELDQIIKRDDLQQAEQLACELIGKLSPQHFAEAALLFRLTKTVTLGPKWLSLQSEWWQSIAELQSRAINQFMNVSEGLESKIANEKAITEANTLRPILMSQNKMIAQKNIELRQAIEELRQYAYIISHDLREPLRMVSSYAKILKKQLEKEQLTDNQLQYFDFLMGGAKLMQQMLSELLRYATMRKAKPVKVELQTLVNEILHEVKTSTAGQIPFDFTTVSVPHTVHAPLLPLRQLLVNLIGNAVKFRKPEGQHAVEFSVLKGSSGWEFRVFDNGIGIDPEQQDRIFLVFQRLHRDEFKGTGLGLAICKKIVLSWGGDISVESEPDKGSAFIFTLPYLEISAEPAEEDGFWVDADS